MEFSEKKLDRDRMMSWDLENSEELGREVAPYLED